MNSKPGSPQSGEPVYLSIGKLRRPHGVKGELLMEVETDFPERVRKGLTIFVGEKKERFEVLSSRNAGEFLLICLTGIENPEQAGLYRNQHVYVEASTLKKLPSGKYYLHEVIGMQVFDEQGKLLGSINEVLVTGANDVYVVKSETGDETLIPAIKSVIKVIDPSNNRMIVQQQEWS